MTELRTHLFGKRGRRGYLPLVATVCLVLLALLAVAQVAHLHPNQADADHCQLCIVLHSVVPTAIAAVVMIFVELGASTPQSEPIVAVSRPQFCLFIRPPPVSC